MKKEVTKIPKQTKVVFICEICRFKSRDRVLAEKCEKKCISQRDCEHDFKYELNQPFDAMFLQSERKCKKCGLREDLEHGSIDVDDFPSDFIELILNKVEEINKYKNKWEKC